MEKSQSEKQESQVDYAYAVIDSVIEAMDKATAKPKLAQHFIVSLLRNMPELVDALMTITIEEHRPQMGKLLKASSEMTAKWVLKMRI